MPQFQTLTSKAVIQRVAVFLAGIPVLAHADPVLWTAKGKVTTMVGTFETSGIQTDDPVGFRMIYDDEAELVETKNVFGLVEADFRKNINLTVTVMIGGMRWSGTVDSGFDPLPATLFTRFYSFPGTEVLEATLDGNDGGGFSSFPFALDGANHTLSAKFSGPNSLLGIGIESLEIDPSVLTAASGFLRSGSTANQLQFSLDPATVSVIDLADEPFSPAVTLASPGSDIELSWTSDPRFDYRLEKKTELDAEEWTVVDRFSGTGGTISRSVLREESTAFFRVVTFPKPR